MSSSPSPSLGEASNGGLRSRSERQALSSVPEVPRGAPSATARVENQRKKPKSHQHGSSSSREPSTSPTAPRPEMLKDSSVQELLLSARESFGEELSPREGAVAIVHHPIRTRPSRMVVAQDWDAAGGEPTSPQGEESTTPTPAASFSPEVACTGGTQKVSGWVGL